MSDPHAWQICSRCAIEAWQVARARNIKLDFGDPVKYVTEFGNRMPAARPSMLQDHLAGRASEIDAINGMVPVAAKEAGLQAPFNEVMTAIVKSREAEF